MGHDVKCHKLEFHDVTVAYGRRPVLWNIDLSIDGPGLFGVIGPNGAGKSTLVKAALGLVPLVGGSVRLFGLPLEHVRPRIGYVPQRETVDWDFPVSAVEVVLMGTYARLGWFRRPGATQRALARECLDRVGLGEIADRQIGRLSGGQQQRVFLARALAQQADLYFLDEPMAGVDARSQDRRKARCGCAPRPPHRRRVVRFGGTDRHAVGGGRAHRSGAHAGESAAYLRRPSGCAG